MDAALVANESLRKSLTITQITLTSITGLTVLLLPPYLYKTTKSWSSLISRKNIFLQLMIQTLFLRQIFRTHFYITGSHSSQTATFTVSALAQITYLWFIWTRSHEVFGVFLTPSRHRLLKLAVYATTVLSILPQLVLLPIHLLNVHFARGTGQMLSVGLLLVSATAIVGLAFAFSHEYLAFLRRFVELQGMEKEKGVVMDWVVMERFRVVSSYCFFSNVCVFCVVGCAVGAAVMRIQGDVESLEAYRNVLIAEDVFGWLGPMTLVSLKVRLTITKLSSDG